MQCVLCYFDPSVTQTLVAISTYYILIHFPDSAVNIHLSINSICYMFFMYT